MKRIYMHIIFVFGFLSQMASLDAISIVLNTRQLCDLEMILIGGFAPLTGFMNQKDYENVVQNMRLVDGSLWPMPIVLDVPEGMAKELENEQSITLVTPEFKALATLEISDIYKPDKTQEALHVYGTLNKNHPGVNYLFVETHDYYVGGVIKRIADVPHYDFVELRKTPAELKQHFKEMGYERVVAYQTRNAMHCAHVELTNRAAKEANAHLLIHPAVGQTRSGDIDYHTRVHCYKEILKYYPEESATLSLLPIAMRMGGPREALWHALIRKNYGCTHFIVGRDHAGPGKDESGNFFYGLYDAQELVKKHAQEIGIEVVTTAWRVCLKDQGYALENDVPENAIVLRVSGTELRKLLKNGDEIPNWFTFPEVAAELKKTYQPRLKQGFTIFITGLPAAGKSTLAHALSCKLQELQNRKVTVLDGDLIRKNLSSELGFSKEHRSLNVRRVGFVANEITKNGGIAVVALIAPYRNDRSYCRELISSSGGFVEVHLDAPLNVCQKRDPKGLYADAAAGKASAKDLPGVSFPYEETVADEARVGGNEINNEEDLFYREEFDGVEIRMDTSNVSVQEEIEMVVNYLRREGYIL